MPNGPESLGSTPPPPSNPEEQKRVQEIDQRLGEVAKTKDLLSRSVSTKKKAMVDQAARLITMKLNAVSEKLGDPPLDLPLAERIAKVQEAIAGLDFSDVLGSDQDQEGLKALVEDIFKDFPLTCSPAPKAETAAAAPPTVESAETELSAADLYAEISETCAALDRVLPDIRARIIAKDKTIVAPDRWTTADFEPFAEDLLRVALDLDELAGKAKSVPDEAQHFSSQAGEIRRVTEELRNNFRIGTSELGGPTRPVEDMRFLMQNVGPIAPRLSEAQFVRGETFVKPEPKVVRSAKKSAETERPADTRFPEINTFDGLAALGGEELEKLFPHIHYERLARALHVYKDAELGALLSVLPEREATAVRRTMSTLGSFNIIRTQREQRTILAAAKELRASGMVPPEMAEPPKLAPPGQHLKELKGLREAVLAEEKAKSAARLAALAAQSSRGTGTVKPAPASTGAPATDLDRALQAAAEKARKDEEARAAAAASKAGAAKPPAPSGSGAKPPVPPPPPPTLPNVPPAQPEDPEKDLRAIREKQRELQGRLPKFIAPGSEQELTVAVPILQELSRTLEAELLAAGKLKGAEGQKRKAAAERRLEIFGVFSDNIDGLLGLSSADIARPENNRAVNFYLQSVGQLFDEVEERPRIRGAAVIRSTLGGVLDHVLSLTKQIDIVKRATRAGGRDRVERIGGNEAKTRILYAVNRILGGMDNRPAGYIRLAAAEFAAENPELGRAFEQVLQSALKRPEPPPVPKNEIEEAKAALELGRTKIKNHINSFEQKVILKKDLEQETTNLFHLIAKNLKDIAAVGDKAGMPALKEHCLKEAADLAKAKPTIFEDESFFAADGTAITKADVLEYLNTNALDSSMLAGEAPRPVVERKQAIIDTLASINAEAALLEQPLQTLQIGFDKEGVNFKCTRELHAVVKALRNLSHRVVPIDKAAGEAYLAKAKELHDWGISLRKKDATMDASAQFSALRQSILLRPFDPAEFETVAQTIIDRKPEVKTESDQKKEAAAQEVEKTESEIKGLLDAYAGKTIPEGEFDAATKGLFKELGGKLDALAKCAAAAGFEAMAEYATESAKVLAERPESIFDRVIAVGPESKDRQAKALLILGAEILNFPEEQTESETEGSGLKLRQAEREGTMDELDTGKVFKTPPVNDVRKGLGNYLAGSGTREDLRARIKAWFSADKVKKELGAQKAIEQHVMVDHAVESWFSRFDEKAKTATSAELVAMVGAETASLSPGMRQVFELVLKNELVKKLEEKASVAARLDTLPPPEDLKVGEFVVRVKDGVLLWSSAHPRKILDRTPEADGTATIEGMRGTVPLRELYRISDIEASGIKLTPDPIRPDLAGTTSSSSGGKYEWQTVSAGGRPTGLAGSAISSKYDWESAPSSGAAGGPLKSSLGAYDWETILGGTPAFAPQAKAETVPEDPRVAAIRDKYLSYLDGPFSPEEKVRLMNETLSSINAYYYAERLRDLIDIAGAPEVEQPAVFMVAEVRWAVERLGLTPSPAGQSRSWALQAIASQMHPDHPPADILKDVRLQEECVTHRIGVEVYGALGGPAFGKAPLPVQVKPGQQAEWEALLRKSDDDLSWNDLYHLGNLARGAASLTEAETQDLQFEDVLKLEPLALREVLHRVPFSQLLDAVADIEDPATRQRVIACLNPSELAELYKAKRIINSPLHTRNMQNKLVAAARELFEVPTAAAQEQLAPESPETGRFTLEQTNGFKIGEPVLWINMEGMKWRQPRVITGFFEVKGKGVVADFDEVATDTTTDTGVLVTKLIRPEALPFAIGEKVMWEEERRTLRSFFKKTLTSIWTEPREIIDFTKEDDRIYAKFAEPVDQSGGQQILLASLKKAEAQPEAKAEVKPPEGPAGSVL